jgi:hypothetical protein
MAAKSGRSDALRAGTVCSTAERPGPSARGGDVHQSGGEARAAPAAGRQEVKGTFSTVSTDAVLGRTLTRR